ncbi:MAG: SelT/SelW/SelH family protein [Deltaproteobacteria bacterium]|nr:MAG: SelT/SelW/SelH family protein [Deltaproteobacteria bacterium]
MAARFRQRFAAETELIESSGGVFEVIVDGRLVHSKKATDRFPDEEALLSTLSG